MLKVRHDIMITIGAAPGFATIMFCKLLGAKNSLVG
jgi:hypothetical protein